MVIECIRDVFGFSRGAAEASVFFNWFQAPTEHGKFVRIPVSTGFLACSILSLPLGVARGERYHHGKAVAYHGDKTASGAELILSI